MYIPLTVKSRPLTGTSDLTLLAPIRPGLVPALDSITYKSRLRRLMEALQLLRQASHEYVPFRPISDSAERVGRIHSFRVAIVEPEDKLLLAVTFDGSREAYVRTLWQKIGTLLDLLFCHTDGHVPSYGHGVAEWDAWIDSVQIRSDFFYSSPRLTTEDVEFMRAEAATRPSSAIAAELASVRRAQPTAEMRARALAHDPSPRFISETARQGVQTIALLHRLTAWFVPGTPDGDFLHRAARDLIPEFAELVEGSPLLVPVLAIARQRFDQALDWFARPHELRRVPAPPQAPPDDALRGAIQGGILEPYAQVTHGALLLMAFRPGAAARPFWELLTERCVSARDQPCDARTVWNVALTHDGLRAAGLSEAERAAFPADFRQGMEARASLLGDRWINHPDRWRRPTHRATGRAIELSTVHVVVQLRCGQLDGMAPALREYDLDDPAHPLQPDLDDLRRRTGGCIELLAMQPMVRHRLDRANPASATLDHFGFADGESDPEFDPARIGKVYTDNLVHPGEFLIGLANAADPPAGTDRPEASEWLRLGSFLVVRKLSQDVAKFRRIVDDAAAGSGLAPTLVAGKLVGRMPDGDPLAAPGSGNDFHYAADPDGAGCPFHAHIRRANPRLPPGLDRPATAPAAALRFPGGRPPRILRRGMSFGRRFDDAPEAPAASRGLCFMAYSASLGEQFETVQRWLAGGNSTGGYSGRSDPLLGLAPPGERRVFAFEHLDAEGRPTVAQVRLDGDDDPARLADLPDPLIRLEWGLYLFTPSLAALQAFGRRAGERARPEPAGRPTWPWSADRGRAAIDRLLALDGERADRIEAWKAALEDPESSKDYSAASIWAAIRRDFGGVLRTPYGVLAADHASASAVVEDVPRRYSAVGYRERAAPTIGDFYLGLDDAGPGCPYRARATEPNRALRTLVDEPAAFDLARHLTRVSIDRLVERERRIATAAGDPIWQLQFAGDEVWDEVLGQLCQTWFGTSDDELMTPGRFRWDWQPGDPVPYPGHFLAPSRYLFQPHPGSEVARLGSLHGTAVNAQFRRWVRRLREQGRLPTAPDGRPAPFGTAFFEAVPRPAGGSPQACAAADERLAVVLLGALIGFLPTVEGNLRQSVNEMLLDGTFWSLRGRLAVAADPPATLAEIRETLLRTMMLRPSPEVIWRRASVEHRLGPLTVQAGETVVVAIVSATHELLERDTVDEGLVFGGWRADWPPGSAVPTHACPGHAAAIGTLLGILTGLLEYPGLLRPSAFPLVFRIAGPMGATATA